VWRRLRSWILHFSLGLSNYLLKREWRVCILGLPQLEGLGLNKQGCIEGIYPALGHTPWLHLVSQLTNTGGRSIWLLNLTALSETLVRSGNPGGVPTEALATVFTSSYPEPQPRCEAEDLPSLLREQAH
jgi:hypothetical protein